MTDTEARALALEWRGIDLDLAAGTTHYEGCEQAHIHCALDRLAEYVIERTDEPVDFGLRPLERRIVEAAATVDAEMRPVYKAQPLSVRVALDKLSVRLKDHGQFVED